MSKWIMHLVCKLSICRPNFSFTYFCVSSTVKQKKFDNHFMTWLNKHILHQQGTDFFFLILGLIYLSGSSMRDKLGTLSACNLDLTAANTGPCYGGAQQVPVFIDCICLHCRPDEVLNELFAQIFNENLHGTTMLNSCGCFAVTVF